MCVCIFFPTAREGGGVKSSDGPIIHPSYHGAFMGREEKEGEKMNQRRTGVRITEGKEEIS